MEASAWLAPALAGWLQGRVCGTRGGSEGGLLAGEGGARAGKRGWSVTRYWRLNCFLACTMSASWCFCLATGKGRNLRGCLAVQRARPISPAALSTFSPNPV